MKNIGIAIKTMKINNLDFKFIDQQFFVVQDSIFDSLVLIYLLSQRNFYKLIKSTETYSTVTYSNKLHKLSNHLMCETWLEMLD